MIKNSKGFVHIFLILTLGLIAFAGIGYLAYEQNSSWRDKNGQIKVAETLTSPLETSVPSTGIVKNEFINQIIKGDRTGWKKFNGYYYEFEFPNGWVFDNEDVKSTDSISFTTARCKNIQPLGDISSCFAWLDVYVNNQSYQEVKNELNTYSDTNTDFTLNGSPAVRFTGSEGIGVYFDEVIIRRDNKNFIISLSTQDETLVKPLSKELDQILSTFKFIE